MSSCISLIEKLLLDLLTGEYSGIIRNALSLAMLQSLHNDLIRDQDSLRVVIIKAKGPVFSAGHDLKELVRITFYFVYSYYLGPVLCHHHLYFLFLGFRFSFSFLQICMYCPSLSSFSFVNVDILIPAPFVSWM